MKIECIVSTYVVVEVDGDVRPSDGTIEALAKNEFFGLVSDLNPDKLAVEIIEYLEYSE